MCPINISAILLLLLLLPLVLLELLLLLILIMYKISETISRKEKVPSREILIYRKVQKST
jgi:Na+-transporting methylmalonyl-CoA/oxaloacetate decarboxylase gamma subunit